MRDGRPGEGGGGLPWEDPERAEYEPEAGERWRGDAHLGDWPESLAGPEYWLYKRERDGEVGDG